MKDAHRGIVGNVGSSMLMTVLSHPGHGKVLYRRQLDLFHLLKMVHSEQHRR